MLVKQVKYVVISYFSNFKDLLILWFWFVEIYILCDIYELT